MIKIEFLRDRVDRFISYIATLYYIEIIYMMFVLNFMFGKAVAVVSGTSLAVLLSVQVVALFNRINLGRKIQLFLMDLHFAYSVAFIFSRLITDFNMSGGDIAVTIYRSITALIELPMIIILTDEFIIRRYR